MTIRPSAASRARAVGDWPAGWVGCVLAWVPVVLVELANIPNQWLLLFVVPPFELVLWLVAGWLTLRLLTGTQTARLVRAPAVLAFGTVCLHFTNWGVFHPSSYYATHRYAFNAVAAGVRNGSIGSTDDYYGRALPWYLRDLSRWVGRAGAGGGPPAWKDCAVPAELTAKRFVADLALFVPAGLREQFETVASALDDGIGNGDEIRADIRTGTVFGLAKKYLDLPPDEIVKLLQSPVHDVRVGAVSIMGQQFVRKKTPDSRRKALYDTYLARTRRIDTWALVDVSGHHVVGGWLVDKPRDMLYELARSPYWWERRLAMWATMAFVRRGELDDTFAIAEILADDPEHFVNTVVGGMVREAGKTDQPRLLEFVDRHAATMPRIALRFAVEHQPADVRKRYYGMAKHQAGSPGSAPRRPRVR